MKRLLVMLGIGICVAGSAGAEIKHAFLAADESRAQLHYVNQFDPSQDWKLPLEKRCRDIQLIDHNRVLVSFSTGYAEYDLKTREKVAELKKPEFHKTESVVRLPNGNTVLGMNRQGIRFFEVTPKGEVVRKVHFPQYKTLRLMRLSPEGNVLFGANENHVVEANWKGEVVADLTLPGAKRIYWVKKLKKDTYRVSTGYGKTLVDVIADGTVLRKLGGAAEYHFFCNASELDNGNVVMANWTGHKPNDSTKGVQLIEFDPQGNVVWKWHDPKRAGTIHGVIILK